MYDAMNSRQPDLEGLCSGAADTVCLEFEKLRDRGHQAVDAGRLGEALDWFERAFAWAESLGEPRLVDLAVCNRAAVRIDLGDGEGELPRLREILLRNGDPVSCRIAAYNIARHYELAKNFKKALFYAHLARDRSKLLGRRDWLASSYNLIGNTLLGESFVERACEQYERALEIMGEEEGHGVARASILDNLGYCRILQGRRREGFALLYRSLRLQRRLGAERYQISTHLDLCFAHLETGRYGYAERHGAMALALAEAMGEKDAVKNALYLLGETAHLSGDAAAALSHFQRLQGDFFPDATYLPGFLLAVDVRKLVNLHA
jgi:tetratricopeptide (TPR) repeat protein